ncbi:MAG: REP-associated tyrosine transposase [Pseudomonas sp.]
MPGNHRSHQMRSGRFSEVGRIYVLTAIVHRRAPVFTDLRAGRLLVEQFKLAQQEGIADSLAWVVMPDHFHWMIDLKGSNLSDFMRRTKSRGARSVNAHLRLDGQLWQKGYYDQAIRQEEDLKTLARYIVANPLRAGLVKRVGDYPLWDAVWL